MEYKKEKKIEYEYAIQQSKLIGKGYKTLNERYNHLTEGFNALYHKSQELHFGLYRLVGRQHDNIHEWEIICYETGT